MSELLQRMPTGNEPLPVREAEVYTEMLASTPDSTGLFDPCGIKGRVVFHDNFTTIKDLTSAELLQITAQNLGGAIVIEQNGRLSNEAKRHNIVARQQNRDRYTNHLPLIYTVLVVGISPEELEDGLEFFDPLENQIQC